MLTRIISLFCLVLTAGIAVAAGAGSAIDVTEAWARATPPGVEVGAAYFVIRNNGSSDDRLVRAASPVAEKVEFHRTTVHDGVARMRQQPSVTVAADGETVFAPGGMHLMLLGLAQPLSAGERFPLALTFERAGTIEVEVAVRRPGAQGHPHRHEHGHGDHGHSHEHAQDRGHDHAPGHTHEQGSHGGH